MKKFNNSNICCYIAAGAFNEQQTKDRNSVRNILADLKINYISPLEEENCDAQSSIDVQEKVFKNNIESINSCSFLIASTTGKDMGTCFECGYAYSKNIPIIYFFPYDYPFNLMLARSGICVVKSESELRNLLTTLIDNNFDFSKTYNVFNGIIE